MTTDDTTWAPVAPEKPKRRFPWKGLIIGIVAFLIGLGVGAVGTQGQVDEQKDKTAAAEKRADRAIAKLDDREAQRRADEATVAAQKATEQRRAGEEARQQQVAAAKAAKDAADAAAAQAAAAVAQAAAAAKKDTARGSGVFGVPADINPGTWHTEGGGQCYYAVLNSTDTFDIQTNNNITGPGTLVVNEGQYLDLSGPCVWTRQG